MSKGYDIKFAIVDACKKHGAGLQLAIDLNLEIQQILDWCERDDVEDAQREQDMIWQQWKDYKD